MIFTEELNGGYHQVWTDYEILVERETNYQKLVIINTKTHGKVLLLDGIVQLTELDEFFYSEAMTHPAILQQDKEEVRVLIIGGGDGMVAEEALKHPNTHVTLCEVDPIVIEECGEHFGQLNNGVLWGHPRFNCIVADGLLYLQHSPEIFDVIIVDRPDPVGPAEVLFEKKFYELCFDRLSPTGMLIAQNGVPLYQPEEFYKTKEIMEEIFPYSGFFQVAVPTYVGGQMAIAWGAKKPLISGKDMILRLCDMGLDLDFFNGFMYEAMRAIPTYLLKKG